MGVNKKGIRDWKIQRLSAIVIALYVIPLVVFMMCHSPMTATIWHDLFANTAVKVFTLLTLAAILWHAWIGVWTILTDYVNISALRVFLEAIVFLALVSFFFWGLFILMGV